MRRSLDVSDPGRTDARLRVAFFGNLLSGGRGGRGVSEDIADRFELRGARVFRASSRLERIPRLVDMLVTAFRNRRDFDVAHVDLYSNLGFVWAECVCFLLAVLGKPYVLTLRGGSLPEFARAHPRRARRLFESARTVVAPSAYLGEAFRDFRGDIVVLPNAVDVAEYRGRVRVAARARFVWVRSFHAMYNPSLAVRVLAGVARHRAEATLVMAGPDKGDGSREAALAEARRLGVADRLELPGNVTKAALPALLADNDIFVNTTSVDNMPVSVLEAMASGLCVVSTNVGGIPYLCRDGANALLVNPDDPQAMTSACMTLIAHPTLAQRISVGALETAAAYDRGPILERWEQLLIDASRREP